MGLNLETKINKAGFKNINLRLIPESILSIKTHFRRKMLERISVQQRFSVTSQSKLLSELISQPIYMWMHKDYNEPKDVQTNPGITAIFADRIHLN